MFLYDLNRVGGVLGFNCFDARVVIQTGVPSWFTAVLPNRNPFAEPVKF
jgi:hypothetical protein